MEFKYRGKIFWIMKENPVIFPWEQCKGDAISHHVSFNFSRKLESMAPKKKSN